MIPELGQLALSLSLFVALSLSILGLAGPQLAVPAWVRIAKPLALILFALLASSFLCLTLSFITNDFSVAYVAGHSN